MPSLPAQILIRYIISAIDESGASGILVSPIRTHPKKIIIQAGQNTFDLWVYVWTLTHGGGTARPKDEYRIQLTGVMPPLSINPIGSSILIGYEPGLQCFAGFDLTRHRIFSTNSPSIQIPITVLEKALQDGFSFVKKGNNEVAVGFRPDQFLAYALNAEALHAQGADTMTVGLLTKAASLETISADEIQQISKDRQRVVTTVSQLARDSGFRRKVIIAYDRRCAVTRMQLQLIDAAHILPVGVKGSNDEVSNSLCLSPTYHRAFDRSLIYLDENLVMRINPVNEKELARIGLNGGIDNFKAYLDKKIHLPADRRQWPSSTIIRRANEFRGIK